MSLLNGSYTSQDLLDRNISSLNPKSSLFQQPSGVTISLTEPLMTFSTTNTRMLFVTLQLLISKDRKDSQDQLATLWADKDGFKIVVEERGVFQCIVMLMPDLFNIAYDIPSEVPEIVTHIPLKLFVSFFELVQVSDQDNLDIFIFPSGHVLLHMKAKTLTSKMKIPNCSPHGSRGETFDLNTHPTALYFKCSPQTLLPSFKSFEWNHQYITLTAKVADNTLTIASSAQGDSVTTVYSKECFDEFECNNTFTARYRMGYFKRIKKVLEKSKQVVMIINSNKLLYIEFIIEPEANKTNAPSSEIAFYISAQIDDVDGSAIADNNGNENQNESDEEKNDENKNKMEEDVEVVKKEEERDDEKTLIDNYRLYDD
ncbi:hypothetical protein EIN_016320 [Entamoeba invadens IP1]|uniref:hypothetical protein n=1 Tax=Entamoeba invadens IP1 TaxID=370355 RepID=UPI0002C3E0EF|nr:hypothetical protein EIN_016320 [Entamoeba invadens IP1]ELP90413.1 hypothetical protein EIN_016320 [Entamoeba invadens IP1]|eukprot:XP_004257184.1 hypothetical protein EIN_016320 [Entamoeba invadens IP1]